MLKSLIALAEQNPYFRNQEVWRIFSSQLAQLDPVLVQQTLADRNTPKQLRELLLEVLLESPQDAVKTTLETIACDESEDFAIRKFSLLALLKVETDDLGSLFNVLFNLGSYEGYDLAALVANHERFPITRDAAFQLLKPTPSWHWSSFDDAHDYITEVLGRLAADDLGWVMDSLIAQHSGKCEKVSPCLDCQEIHSKELGRVLDVYFEVAEPPEPEVIARVVQHMKFFRDIPSHMSASVKRLREDDSLRRKVQELVLARAIADQAPVLFPFWSLFPHSGIRAQPGDHEHLAVWCETNKEWNAWRQLIPTERSEEATVVRRFMKGQARTSFDTQKNYMLIGQWELKKRKVRDERLAFLRRFGRVPNYQKRRATLQAQRKFQNKLHFNQNRDKILAGEHDGWLEKFAHNV